MARQSLYACPCALDAAVLGADGEARYIGVNRIITMKATPDGMV